MNAARGFEAVHPPAPPRLRPMLIAAFVGLGLPALVTVAAAFAASQLPALTRLALVVVVAVTSSAGVAVLLRKIWPVLGLPGRGPEDHLPLRWLQNLFATKRVADHVDLLRSVPSGPASLETLKALAKDLERRDFYTRVHSGRVSRLAWDLFRQLGRSEEECEVARLAGLLHDIGKLQIPDSILFKPGPLEGEELLVMQQHPSIGADLVAPFMSSRIVDAVLHHHERIDGSGYPHGVRAETLDLLSRVIPVCDVYDSMTGDRPYQPARSKAEALAELQTEAGGHLDAEIVWEFVQLQESRRTIAAGLGAFVPLAPIGGIVRRIRYLAHASTAPAASALAAVTAAATIALVPSATGPVDSSLAAQPAAVRSEPEPVSEPLPAADSSEVPEPAQSRAGTGSRRAAPSSEPSSPPSQPPPPPPQPPPASCRLPVGPELPRLPLIGCIADLVRL